MKKLVVVFFLLGVAQLLQTVQVFAQGDGTRSFMLLPKGVTGVNARWLGMNQNLNASGTILIPRARSRSMYFRLPPSRLFHWAEDLHSPL